MSNLIGISAAQCRELDNTWASLSNLPALLHDERFLGVHGLRCLHGKTSGPAKDNYGKKAPLLNGPNFKWWSTRVWTTRSSRFTEQLVIGVINLALLEKPLNTKKTASQEFPSIGDRLRKRPSHFLKTLRFKGREMQRFADLDHQAKMAVEAKIQADLDRLCGDDPRRLEHFGYKVYSQSDEDGSIRWTYRDQIASGQLKFTSSFVYPTNINQLISDADISGEIDLLSIDIDSNDWFVWQAISVINPRVVCIEHNHGYPPPMEYVMPYKPDYYWDGTGPAIYGSSLSSNCKLGQEKGYTLVGCGLYSANGFFVRNDLLGDHFNWGRAPETHWKMLDYKSILMYPNKLASEV
eukprot:gene15542-20984_t